MRVQLVAWLRCMRGSWMLLERDLKLNFITDMKYFKFKLFKYVKFSILVKLGWFWTLILAVPFLWFTSFVTNCGDRNKILYNHLPRIAIATFFWFVWTKIFNVIENNYGRCHVKTYETKRSCLKSGNFWHSFDISGHTFILIYSSLVLIEEAKPIVGWDNIKDYLRLEDHNRKTQEPQPNPLRALNDNEIITLKTLYEKYTPIIRLLFVGITVLQLLWDIMLVCTMIYYHRMAEKIVSGLIAIVTWYFTYRAWYPSKSILPLSAGKGLFNYQQKIVSLTASNLGRRASLLNAKLPKPSSSATKPSEVPKFMGNPIYKSAAQRSELNAPDGLPATGKYDNFQPPSKFV